MSSSSSLAIGSRPVPPRWLAPLACAPPLAYYVASASAFGGLYEEGSFVAAARSLGVPHPPGAPLTSLAGAVAALIPIGPLSFRVAVSSAVFTGCILALFARALFHSLRGVGLGARGAGMPALLALAGTWFAAGTPLFFSVATRPNVYALQFALGLWMIDALVRFESSEPTDDRRALYLGAFVQGLSFANHHVFALLLLSVAAPTLGRVFARRGFLGLMGHVAAPILGFSAWIYVPIRGGRAPFINIGAPDKLTRIFWVLNADPWRGPSGLPEPPTWSLLSRGIGSSTLITVLVLALAALGLALAARTAGARRFALLWGIAFAVPFASIAWILEPTLQADAWGAMLPCALAMVALATCGIGLGLRELSRSEPAGERVGLALCAGALLALLWHAAPGSRAAEQIDMLTRRDLPTRAVVIASDLASSFRWLGAEAEEHLRGDVTMLPLGALDYPHTVESLSERAPELAPVLGSYTQAHELTLPTLRTLSRKRPVLLELDRNMSASIYPALSPAGWYQQLGGQPHGQSAWSDLYARLGDAVREPDLGALLVQRQLYQAIAAAAHDRRELALQHIALGLRSDPRARRLLLLREALDEPGRMDAATLLQRSAH